MRNDGPWTLDTNVLVYATEVDSPPKKQEIAKQLLEQLLRGSQAGLPGQVLSEFMNLVVKKKAMSFHQAHDAVTLLSETAKIFGASKESYRQAWELAAKHQYQVWNALIIAVCAEHGIKTLYSEDLGSRKRPLGVHVINPFANLETV